MSLIHFWQNKSVFITGASSGIGRALAEHLAGRGAKLGLVARREDVLAELAESLRGRGATAAFAVADVVDRQAVEAAVRTLEEQLGPCDVLVANAGIYRKTAGRNFDAVKADQVIATNVQGVIHSIAAVLPGMVARRRGHIAAVASMAGALGLPGAAAYCASKAAVRTLMESLRVDLWRLGIRVTTICPGYVDTPLLTVAERASRRDMLGAEDTARRIAQAIQQGRAETWFPRATRFWTRLARLLPPRMYCRILARYPEMEEAETGN
jgi:NADP-dependent 3-hydroxy acid dehydrogenase YdfG